MLPERNITNAGDSRDAAAAASGQGPMSSQIVRDQDSELRRLETLLEEERAARKAAEVRLVRQIALTERRIKGHLSYRLGQEIVASGRSPLAWLGLPRRMIRAYSDFKRESPSGTARRAPAASPALVQAFRDHGAAGVLAEIRNREGALERPELARELLRAGQALAKAGVEGVELALTAEAVRIDSSLPILRARFWACHRAAAYTSAHEVAERLWKISEEQDLGPEERERLDRIFRHPIRQLSILNLVRQTPERSSDFVPGRLCYLLHNSLPYSSGGYATRSHGLASALKSAGRDIVVVTRPGFPLDISSYSSPDALPEEDQIDGIRYLRLFDPGRRDFSPPQYIGLAAESIEKELRRQRPEVVVAASNHLTGLPALIAARRLGLPFFYEVRGLWEITRLSREPEFSKNINYWLQRELEAAVAKNADGVFTLTDAMREELEERGVPAEKITLLPNSCDASQFSPREKDRELQRQLGLPDDIPVIGYVGTFVGYEGLDDLAEAAGMLRRRGFSFRLLLVGNEDASGTGRGEITDAIERRARQDGFLDWLIMPGRVPHELVPRYYSLIDITPFPRKPLPVCEMVSPIKPLEAIAMEKAVLVSDVRALAEMVRDGETGLLFRKGDVNDLAEKLGRLLCDLSLRERLGRNGRRWVQEERSWSAAAQRMQSVIRACIGP